MLKAIPTMRIEELKPHPKNTEIYGEEDVRELAEKIKESGWIKPIVMTTDCIIISGHRRIKACELLGIEEVEYEIIHFNNENEELERLLLENQSREKTNEQKIREGLIWEEVVKEKARLRKLSTLKNNDVDKENFPQQEKGQTRDIVAEKVGIGSGKTYESAKKVVKEIDKLKDEGKEKDAKFLKITLNESVNSAKNLLKTDLGKIDEDLKDKVLNNEITAKTAVKEINEITVDKEIFPQQEQQLEDQKPTNHEMVTEIKMKVENQPDIITNFEADKDNFIKTMHKYIELEDIFAELNQENKSKVIDCMTNMKDTIDKIMNFLY